MATPPTSEPDILNARAIRLAVVTRLRHLASELDDRVDPTTLPTPALYNLYLVSSVLYYRYDQALMQDASYDALCQELLRRADNPGVLWHAQWYDTDALRAGTGYHIQQLPALLEQVVAELLAIYQPKGEDVGFHQT